MTITMTIFSRGYGYRTEDWTTEQVADLLETAKRLGWPPIRQARGKNRLSTPSATTYSW